MQRETDIDTNRQTKCTIQSRHTQLVTTKRQLDTDRDTQTYKKTQDTDREVLITVAGNVDIGNRNTLNNPSAVKAVAASRSFP